MTGIPYTLGITGHRKLLRKEAFLRALVTKKLSALKEAHPEGLRVLTGMALGFDQLVAELCLELGVSYVAAVPCDAQDALWTPEQREKYARLLLGASEVVNVSPGPYAAWKMHARNRWIVDRANEMLVHWDGMYTGGTGGCMKLVAGKKLSHTNTLADDSG